MKKVFFISKFNKTFEGMHYYLRGYFEMQICIPNLTLVSGMLKAGQTDAILICLADMNRESIAIFDKIYQTYPQVPVICVGTYNEQMHFEEYITKSQFHMITRPIENEQVLVEICKVLRLEYDPVNQTVDGEERKLKRVLMVDDNALQIRTLSAILQERYEVLFATSGIEALSIIDSKKPDIIFLDYEMPDLDGKLTFQMIKQTEGADDIPVFFLTGVNDRAHIQAVLDLKPAGYLLKPASAEMVLNITNKYLENNK